MSKAARKSFNITAWPGDGIGKAVTASAFQVLTRCQRLWGNFEINTTWVDWGCNYYEQNGRCVPEGFLDQLKNQDAVFLGAIGYPSKVPDHITLAPLVELRQGFDLYACVRPARTYPNVPTPLKSTETHPVDMVVVRENTEGEYVKQGGFFNQGTPEEYAVQEAVHTRKGIERVLRFGFEMARKPERRNKLTMITKSNALIYGAVLWDNVFDELCSEYPDVEAEKQHVDAAAMNFVLRPQSFDVVVASNLFGDILTDLSGSITGSLGLNPSANLNPSRQFPSLFEPVHGSAPDIDGLGIANPTGAILTSAQMLRWIDPEGNHCGVAPKAIELAIETKLSSGNTTKDLGGTLSTDEFTSQVLDELENIYTRHCVGEISLK